MQLIIEIIEMKLEKTLAYLCGGIVAVPLALIVGFLAMVISPAAPNSFWESVVGWAGGAVGFVLASTSLGSLIYRKIFVALAARQEPGRSCIEVGLTGAGLVGSGMMTGILAMGHTRPGGWDFITIPPAMVGAFIISYFAGYPLSSMRKRRS